MKNEVQHICCGTREQLIGVDANLQTTLEKISDRIGEADKDVKDSTRKLAFQHQTQLLSSMKNGNKWHTQQAPSHDHGIF